MKNKIDKNINGVKASLKVKGNKVIYTVDIQYDSDYMKDLVEAGLVSTNSAPISFAISRDSFR